MSVQELFTGIIERVDRGQSRVVMCLLRDYQTVRGNPLSVRPLLTVISCEM